MKEADALSIPKGWEIKKLGDVCEKTNNIKWANNERELEYIDLSSVSREKLVVTKSEKITKFNAPSRAKKIVLEKDVIFATTRPTLKRVAIINRQYTDQICSTGFCILRPKEIVEEKWIFSFIQTDEFMNRMEKLQRGASYPAVTDSDVKNTLIPLPPLLEQKHIVSILDRAFEAIDKAKANAEQNLKNANELFESYLQGVFENKGVDWEEKTIQEITKVINGYAFPSREFKPTNSIKSIKITNVGVKNFVEETENYLPEKYKDRLNEIKVKEENIVIALTRTIISAGLKVAVVPKNYDNSLVNQRVAALVPKKELINQRFLYNFLISNEVAKYVLAHVNTLMQPNLSITDLKNMLVPLPSLSEQQQIVQKLDILSAETKKLESIYQQKIDNLDELKKSILQKAFAGELK